MYGLLFGGEGGLLYMVSMSYIELDYLVTFLELRISGLLLLK